MENPKISILIANYNNGHFFKDCYNSLMAQTEKNWEAIVIDDGSTDNSVEVIKDLIQQDTRFRFYQNEENLGYQKTLIKGISLSRADIFGRLDPDDAFTPNALEASIKAHLDFPEVGLVYSNFIFCDDLLVPTSAHKATQIQELDVSAYYNFAGEISHLATFKKAVYNQTSGIDIQNKKAEDKDIYMKMCEVAPVKYIDEDLYLYRVHAGGISTNSNTDKAYFWHWVALIKMAERRNVNIENLFLEKFVRKERYDFEIAQKDRKLSLLKKSRILKLLYKIGLFKAYKYL
ncbi:glycosyltransferase family 2 protein [Chryseobacterium sp. RR2-3-20]|uniref:glycosyltransferase family 2 protein n=1 Tax=Chryseobacterium sp. RR2-3-20 TaxID=2787626 RepID=UPI001AE03950|nr:glycosyltransferase family 2 protein [Chryseobacterium sp. RR2-3-20]